MFSENPEKNRHADFVEFWGEIPWVGYKKIDLSKIIEN